MASGSSNPPPFQVSERVAVLQQLLRVQITHDELSLLAQIMQRPDIQIPVNEPDTRRSSLETLKRPQSFIDQDDGSEIHSIENESQFADDSSETPEVNPLFVPDPFSRRTANLVSSGHRDNLSSPFETDTLSPIGTRCP
jgi:hypothetical protein